MMRIQSNRKRCPIPVVLARWLIAMAAMPWVLSTQAQESLKIGDSIPAFKAKDQHDQPFEFPGKESWILLSFDMETGKSANQTLSDMGKDFLPKHGAAYVANMDGMPAIGRFFALRKMQKYNHRIILSDQKGFMDAFPQKAGEVTLLKTDSDRQIVLIRHWNPKADDAAKTLETLLNDSNE